MHCLTQFQSIAFYTLELSSSAKYESHVANDCYGLDIICLLYTMEQDSIADSHFIHYVYYLWLCTCK